MTKVRLFALLAVVALLLFPAMASAQGSPIPCRFHGKVQVDGSDVADGTTIKATIEGDTYTTTTPDVYGASTYAIKIVPPEGTAYAGGTEIIFMIGDRAADRKGHWEAGGNIELDLSFPAIDGQAPQLPCRFYGKVQVDGSPVADGTVITATIEGDEYPTTTPAVYGASTYGLKIAPPGGTVYAKGTEITFTIGNRTAEQPGHWEAGVNIELDLSAGEEPVEPPVSGEITDVVVITFAAGEQDPSGFDSVTGVLTVGIPAVITSVEYEDLPSGAAGNATLEDGVLTLYIPTAPAGAAGEKGEPGGGAHIAIPIVALVLAVIAIGVSVMSIRRRV